MLVALSGGGDSTALLHLLVDMAPQRRLRLVAAHFDHGLRPESSAEAHEVAARSEAAGVPCRVGRAAGELTPDQAALREARYAFLRESADEAGADRIATAHQADDQVETVLFRMLRGTGLAGLAGIPARRGSIVRPLLPFGRDELRSWLERRDAPYLDDPSNRDPRWARPRIRRELLPALEAAWDEAAGRLGEVARAAGRADAALDARAGRTVERARRPSPRWGWHEAVALDRPVLRTTIPEIRGRAVRLLAERTGVTLSGGGTRQANQFISEGRSGGRVDLGGGLVLAREFDRFVIGRPASDRPDTTLSIDGGAPGRGTLAVGGRRVAVRWRTHRVPADGALGGDADRVVTLSERRLGFPLRLRGWTDGDRLRTGSGTRKLKELFREARVPESHRSRLVVAEDGDGTLVWVEGIGRDPELAPRAGDRAFSLRSEDV
ncbi:MAG: tRNA lysidine(34) synthetase TilS [Gemmatimonadota bacterium]|nr:tRNA lysidine(34) synthetase TilS [Gemmatimonadota bacterium]